MMRYLKEEERMDEGRATNCFPNGHSRNPNERKTGTAVRAVTIRTLNTILIKYIICTNRRD
jgi:hypothetical protein